MRSPTAGMRLRSTRSRGVTSLNLEFPLQENARYPDDSEDNNSCSPTHSPIVLLPEDVIDDRLPGDREGNRRDNSKKEGNRDNSKKEGNREGNRDNSNKNSAIIG